MTALAEPTGDLRAVLLCDDGTPLGAALIRTAAEAGFAIVSTTMRASELLELTAAHRPDVVVVDLALSGQGGMSLLVTLHALAPRCPVMAAVPLGVMETRSVPGSPAVVVDPSDLRPLAVALRRLSRRRIDHPS